MQMCVQHTVHGRKVTIGIAHRQTVPKTRPVAFLG